ncbi:MAG: acetyl-CoA carboxylase carboxyl transferase subunit beta [Treponema sp.]|jgi:acetyl-CoA carboxylase carboxyl transferase subunit beta|nr:acetyl-CoA carboxylase carboxyl transferase subunit beta [Treponema sp.]
MSSRGDTGAVTCPHCGKTAGLDVFIRNYRVCGSCGYHARLTWQERLEFTADPGSFIPFDTALHSVNPLNFPGYTEKLAALQEACGTPEAVVTGRCTIMGYAAVLGIMDSYFLMASMGSVVGEKIARAFEYSAAEKLPLIICTASGGARMQEGIFSLLQMAKTSGAAAWHNRAGQLYISVITDPTTGGVTASFASLGDLIIAEPGAMFGFAGKRVIQDTIGAELPEHFQTAELVYEHGFVDMIVPRSTLRSVLSRVLRMHGYPQEVPPCPSA